MILIFLLVYDFPFYINTSLYKASDSIYKNYIIYIYKCKYAKFWGKTELFINKI